MRLSGSPLIAVDGPSLRLAPVPGILLWELAGSATEPAVRHEILGVLPALPTKLGRF
jgi:hypothetical protein